MVNVIQNTIVRYLFAIAAVASTFALRIWLIPFTGAGAPFVMFFAAVLVTSMVAGVGPGICSLLISMPLAAYMFVTRAGYPPSQAAFQALLFAIDGIVVIYLTHLMRAANEEITRSMARNREVIEISPDAFFQADLDARVTDVNQAACRLLGYERDELIGKTIFDIIPVEDAARLRAVRAELLVPGKVNRAEWTQKRKDGTFVSVEVSSNILPDGRWQAFVRDITEHKRAEEALQRSEREFRELAESMPQIVWATTPDGLNIYFNQQWVDYTGLTLEESHGEGWITPFHPDDRQRAWEAWQRATQHRDAYSLECRLRRADGVYQWWLIRGVPLLNESGDVIKWFGTCTDIEQIKVAEQRLKESDAKQQFLAEAGALLATSLDYQQTLANVAHLVVRDLADWCIVEVMDEHGQIRRLQVVSGDPSKADISAFLEHMPIDHDRPYLLRAVFETKQSLLIEHFTPERIESLAQGPEHLQALRGMNPTSMMAVPLLRHERLLGAVAWISSSGSRQYGQSDLPLAEAVAERAAIAIENARLYRASVNATQLRDQVLGVVAHDLRNPLSTILTQVWALKHLGPEHDRPSLKPADVIQRAAKRMNRLIQDLLDVAVVEAGQLTIERARLSAIGLIGEAVETQRPLASSSSLELRVEVESDIPEVWGDRDRLLQVFDNLIGNAIKFTKPGGRITAGATSRDEEVVFWVADTGRGIASENLPRVFDRFWQATRAGRQGAGLGLPITKGIVEAHAGRIWVESTAGSGSTFFFTIPRVSAAQDFSDRSRPDRAA